MIKIDFGLSIKYLYLKLSLCLYYEERSLFNQVLPKQLDFFVAGFGELLGICLRFVWKVWGEVMGMFGDMLWRLLVLCLDVCFYAKMLVSVEQAFVLENFGAKKLGSIA